MNSIIVNIVKTVGLAHSQLIFFFFWIKKSIDLTKHNCFFFFFFLFPSCFRQDFSIKCSSQICPKSTSHHYLSLSNPLNVLSIQH